MEPQLRPAKQLLGKCMHDRSLWFHNSGMLLYTSAFLRAKGEKLNRMALELLCEGSQGVGGKLLREFYGRKLHTYGSAQMLGSGESVQGSYLDHHRVACKRRVDVAGVLCTQTRMCSARIEMYDFQSLGRSRGVGRRCLKYFKPQQI